MITLHAIWFDSLLHLWGERDPQPATPSPSQGSDEPTEGQTSRPSREGPGGSEGWGEGAVALPSDAGRARGSQNEL